jgi:NADH-ubiquinone oxidoreductase chain 1
LFPVFLIFFIGSVAETNRAPFDLAEAISHILDLASLKTVNCWKIFFFK